MTVITDAQDLSAVNAHTDTNNNVAGSLNKSNAVQNPITFVSGTARQVSTDHNTTLYINVTTAAALTIAMGPTSAVANPVTPSQSSGLGVITLRVPVGWYVKLTGTMGNLVTTYSQV